MPDGLAAVVRSAAAAGQWLPSGSRVVVAVSGGADSVALLHLLRSLSVERRLALHVAHLDHALRKDSHEDAAFVRALAHRWRLPVTIARWPVGERCEREGWSLEDGARRLRYQFLDEVARTQSASLIALAHTADDQAETVLLRLLRGAGLLGLSAMPAARRRGAVRLIRPLLGIWRRDLLAYLRQEGIAWREDATNRDPRFLRNRVRHELLPLLEGRFNPNIKAALVQLAAQTADDYAYLQAAALRQWKRLAKRRTQPEPAVAIRVAGFLRQPAALQRQLLRQAVLELRGELTAMEFRHWEQARRLFAACPVGTVLSLPGSVRLRRETDVVVCRLAEPGGQNAGLRPPRQSEYTTALTP